MNRFDCLIMDVIITIRLLIQTKLPLVLDLVYLNFCLEYVKLNFIKYFSFNLLNNRLFYFKLADKNLIDEALKKSEELQIEQAMLDDKLKATDWEATNEELMEMVARESYLQWIKDNEKRNFKTSNPSYDDYLDNLMNHNAPCSSWDSLRNDYGSSNCGNTKSNNTASSNNNNNNSSDKNKKLFDDWSNYETVVDDEEDDILAKVLQDSQQEYLENLKSNRSQNKD